MFPGMPGPYGPSYPGMGSLSHMFQGSAGLGLGLPGPLGSAAESLAAAANEKARAFLPPVSSSHYPGLESSAGKLTDSIAQRAAELSSYPYPSPAGLSSLLPSAAAAHSAHASAMAAAASLHGQHLSAAAAGLAAAGQYPLPPSYMPPVSTGSTSTQDIHRPVAYVLVKPEDHYRQHVPGAVI